MRECMHFQAGVALLLFFFVCVGCVCLCQRTYVLLVEILFKYVPLSFGVCVRVFSPFCVRM